MKIVGIYGALDWDANQFDKPKVYVHDSGATLFVDGKHVRTISEERLTRIKCEGNYPSKSIDYCLGDIPKEDIDVVCFSPGFGEIYEEKTAKRIAKNMLKESFPNAKIWFVAHHIAHAASAVFTAPFNSGSFLTLDGLGSGIWDFASGHQRFAENNSIGYFDKRKSMFRFFRNFSDVGVNSFGEFYCNFSKLIYSEKQKQSIKKNSDLSEDVLSNIVFAEDLDVTPKEGKIMGLSSYGKEGDNLEDPFTISNHHALKLFDIDRYEFGIPNVDFYDYQMVYNGYLSGSPEDKAYYLQSKFEKALVSLIKDIKDNYLEENHCFAGGCFLNICTNTLLKPLFKNLHIPPFTSDTGISYGAAAYASFKLNEPIEIPSNLAFLGKDYDDFVPDLENYEYYDDFDELCEVVSCILENNKIVGWFQGKSEHGPRALGNRSILMSPKRAENKDIMNNRIKHREPWRPFAGIMLEDRVSDYFVEGEHTPYMLYSQTVKSDKIPAITHEDKSCRIQTVNKELNPKICNLLSKLQDPILLNTSFNHSGEPIVETPEDAIDTFKKCDMDYLVIGNYLIWN